MDVVVGILVMYIAVFSLVAEGIGPSFNVIDFGAAGDGQTDDSGAFVRAWKALCEAKTTPEGVPILNIPEGKTFLLQPVKFTGPCNSSVRVQILGNLVAPRSVSDWKNWQNGWLSFSYVLNLTISGTGQIDGQGAAWWNIPQLFNNSTGDQISKNPNRPKALHFNGCNNLMMRGLTHINSPLSHISVNGCNGVVFSHLHIIAPKDSPNTDGIDISRSTHVKIRDSYIATGDDCVAINGNSSQIRVINVACGPGHGISVGSLGAQGSADSVEEVYIHNCTFNGTQNGARIKTWQGGRGFAKVISFTQITLIDTENPIIIDQHYCNGEKGCTNATTAVVVSDVTFSGFQGTSAKKEAIRLDCSEIGCSNVTMDNVDITPSIPSEKLYAYCKNVYGTSFKVTPPVDCLSGS